jgi:hypothetical protein
VKIVIDSIINDAELCNSILSVAIWSALQYEDKRPCGQPGQESFWRRIHLCTPRGTQHLPMPLLGRRGRNQDGFGLITLIHHQVSTLLCREGILSHSCLPAGRLASLRGTGAHHRNGDAIRAAESVRTPPHTMVTVDSVLILPFTRGGWRRSGRKKVCPPQGGLWSLQWQ